MRLRAVLAATANLEPRPPASLDRVLGFEARFAISLPGPYRRFVLEVADGLVYEGASWLYSLDEIARDLGETGSRPARPFWYGDVQAAALRAAAAEAAGNLFTPEVMALQRNGVPDGCLTLTNNGGTTSRCWS